MIASPLRPRQRQESGIAAAGRLAHRGTPYGASLSFATTTHLWPLSDPPSRELRSATSRTGAARSIPGRALASSMLDSPCQGSRTGLTPPISTPVPSTPNAYALRSSAAGSSLRALARSSRNQPHPNHLLNRCRDQQRHLPARRARTEGEHPAKCAIWKQFQITHTAFTVVPPLRDPGVVDVARQRRPGGRAEPSDSEGKGAKRP